MPRRNMFFLILVPAVSLICYQSIQTHRLGDVWVQAMETISERSLKEVDREDLFEGAMKGMVDCLDDRYSAYIPPSKLESFNEDLDQQFAGVGMMVSSAAKTGQLTVANPVVGRPSPAYEQGIRVGDTIRRIDGHSTQGLSLGDAVGYLRGKPDTPVVLSVLHRGGQQPVRIELVRKVIRVDTVLGDVREVNDLSWNFFLEGYDRIGYVRITNFAKNTAKELQSAMQWLHERDMRALILDMRGNPGGLLTAAEEVCDTFIDSGVIVSRTRRDGEVASTATAPGTYLGFPMAVLVDNRSASASEIVAACLQDHQRAVVVGERTWGKGTVQEVITLPDNRGAMRLTISGYLRPNRKNIHREKNDGEDAVWGVKPDEGFKVVLAPEDRYQLIQWRHRRDLLRLDENAPDGEEKDVLSIDKDPQLAKAVEYVEGREADRLEDLLSPAAPR